MVKLPKLNFDPPETWRWWAYMALFALFPVLFHPRWLTIISLAAYTFLMILLLQRKSNTK